MNRLLTTLLAAAFATSASLAFAQGTAPASTDSMAKSDKKAANKAKASEAQKTAAEQSKSTASGAVPTGGATKSEKLQRSGDKKADFAAQQKSLQAESTNTGTGSAKVDKSKPKATKEERKAISKDVGKGEKGN
jgi:hypothetical protein